MGKVKVILVDDNVLFRFAMKKLLVGEFNLKIIGEASCADDFMALNGLCDVDLVFMDVLMPGMDGITLTKKVIQTYPSIKIIAVTLFVDQVYLHSLITAGFKGCINKNNLYEEIEEAIVRVTNNQLYFPNYIATK